MSGETISARLRADPDLGKVADAELARRHACSHELVRLVRTAAGIATPRRARPGVARALASADLGEVRDTDLSERLGLPVHIVRAARRVASIPRATVHPTVSAVLEAVLEGHRTLRAIHKVTGLKHIQKVCNILSRLCAEGTVVRVAHGEYEPAPGREGAHG